VATFLEREVPSDRDDLLLTEGSRRREPPAADDFLRDEASHFDEESRRDDGWRYEGSASQREEEVRRDDSRSDIDLDNDGREEEYRAEEGLGRESERFWVEDLREED